MKLLITGAWIDAKSHFEELRLLGYELYWMPDERGELPFGATEAEGVVCNGLFLYHSLDSFPALQFIQLTSAGYDRVPMDEITRRGITICNAKDVYSIPMAEFALCGVLQLYKQSRFFLRNQEEHRWEKRRELRELYGKTVCIIGTGSVGIACAARFNAFGCRVLGVNTHMHPVSYFDQVYSVDELDTVLQQSDIVVLAVPLTDQTKKLMDKKRFQTMKARAILVNLSRGAVVDTDALLDAINGRLGGAVLDVFEEEPLPVQSPLWTYETVLITPHNSFVGEHNQARLGRVIYNNLFEISQRE